MKTLSRIIRKLLPERIYRPLFSYYHRALAELGAMVYGFPSRKLFVIGVTGTKGKSTTAELIYAILRRAGYHAALASTIHFVIGEETSPNLFKMTMPGRFFLQQFLRRAANARCTHVVVEMTSEGAVQFRHKGIELNALVFTNLAPEHLEAHGGMENYVAAKLSLARHLEDSPKRPRFMVANADDHYGMEFLKTNIEVRVPFSLRDAKPYTADEHGVRFFWRGKLLSCPLPGEFNLQNILAALTLTEAIGIPYDVMEKAIAAVHTVPGRAERVERGQHFTAIVDYAHTPDSLRALYQTYRKTASQRTARLICVLGSTGGGRDVWKRPAMGKIADEFCDLAYLTDEDPYDEDSEDIIGGVAKGFSRIVPRIILSRRDAIHAALREARAGDTVVITGKGTDPYIMRARGAKEPWSDTRVVEEELDTIMKSASKSSASI